MSAVNLIGDLATTQIWNSRTQSQSWTNLEDGKRGKKTKIKVVFALELACGSLPNPYYRRGQRFLKKLMFTLLRLQRQSTRFGIFSKELTNGYNNTPRMAKL